MAAEGVNTPNSEFSSESSIVKRDDRLGFIGLGQLFRHSNLEPLKEAYGLFKNVGNMGTKMCENLVKWAKLQGLPPVTVWNKTVSSCDPFRDMGCLVAPSVKEMPSMCDIILTCVANDSAVESVYVELFSGMDLIEDEVFLVGQSRPRMFVSTETIDPLLAGKLERLASCKPNRYFLACPVFGPPSLAKSGELLIVLSGEHRAKNYVHQFLVPAIASRAMILGADVEKASTLTLLGNAMILGVIELLAETMTLADKSNVGAETLYKFITEFFPTPTFIGYGKKIADDNFTGEEGFTLEGGIKDAKLIRSLGEKTSTPLPIIDVALQHLLTAKANGGSSLDWSSLVGGQRIASGLHPFTRSKALTLYQDSPSVLKFNHKVARSESFK